MRHMCPDVDCKLYVDDRTWTAATAERLVESGGIWTEASDIFGFVENRRKEQWVHKTPKGRKRLQQAGVAPERIGASAIVLGAKVA